MKAYTYCHACRSCWRIAKSLLTRDTEYSSGNARGISAVLYTDTGIATGVRLLRSFIYNDTDVVVGGQALYEPSLASDK